MKSTRYTLYALLALLLGLTACNKENVPATPEEQGLPTVHFSMKQSTRAVDAGNSSKQHALDYEKEITSLVIAVFGKDDQTLKQVVPDGSIRYTDASNRMQGGTFRLPAGEYTFEFIANADPSILDKLTVGLSLDAFKTLVIAKALPVHDEQAGFVMNSPQPTNKKVETTGTTDLGTITLRRLAARIDVLNNVDDFKMTSIVLKNQATKSFLFEKNPLAVPDGAAAGEASFSHADWFTDDAAVAGIYTYEQPGSNNLELEVTGTYQNGDKTIKIPLYKKGSTSDRIDIQRNHLYRIYITKNANVTPPAPQDNEFTITITVADWEDGDDFTYTDNELGKMTHQLTGIVPLASFAEHNVKGTAHAFDAGDRTADGYLKTWTQAANTFKAGKKIGGKTYYLPTLKEWSAIVPEYEVVKYAETKEQALPDGVVVTIGGKDYNMSGTYINDNATKTAYATLKYVSVDNPDFYICAIAKYRYELPKQSEEAGKSNVAKLEITMAETQEELSIDAAKSADTWTAQKHPVKRSFIAAGDFDNNTRVDEGKAGFYWAADEYDQDTQKAHYMGFGPYDAGSGNLIEKTRRFSIRLVTRE